LNDSRIVRPPELAGCGLDAQWNDDFHHVVHALLTKEKAGYYEDFGPTEQLTTAYSSGYVYAGQYSAYRQRHYGNSSGDVPARRFVVFSQNHDQVGNRAQGERLSELVCLERLKLAAVLLSPFVPLLFMGEEYGEPAPFQYFVSHSDPALIEAVRKGRSEEFAKFQWKGQVPDPQAEETFERSRLNWSLRERGKHQMLRSFYAELLRLRRSVPALSRLSKTDMRVWTSSSSAFGFERWAVRDRVLGLFNFGEQPAPVCAQAGAGLWRKLIDSADRGWAGPGCTSPQGFHLVESVNLELPALSFSLFQRTAEGE
jgi:maltooligosyltrehalose trehalohydrolase